MADCIDRARDVLGKALAVVLAVALTVSLCPAPAYAASSTPSKKSVLSFVKKYDKDGYYLLSTMNKHGDKIMTWWSGGSDVFDNIDTMVHEECHGYSFISKPGVERIYVGNKKAVKVTNKGAFRSKKIAKSVPKRLRTMRYWTYVGKPSANLASDVEGAYGLLNEFMAYCWGFNSTVKLYSYAKSFRASDDLWVDYLSGSSSVALARAEFRYFIEHYLYYAKKHKKAVYRSAVGNKAFVRAVRKIDAKFASLIGTYDKRLAEIASLLRAQGYEVEIDGDTIMAESYDGGSGTSLYMKEYNRFATELGKSRYKAIEKKLGLKRMGARKAKVGDGQAASGDLVVAWSGACAGTGEGAGEGAGALAAARASSSMEATS